ncbi:MAG TPA: T9SS type A sorting domain-containing protein, partial [Candidatus Kryptobacter bacterium]|nr:T9SS type A sorting domain-containing protein [Candidatus Kryptobacter bacterium]
TFNGVVPPVKPVMTIAAARTDGNSDLKPDNLGDTVQVFGVVTTPNLSGTTTSYFIQDGTGAIDVFYNGTLGRTFQVGDSVSVIGSIAQYRGLTEIIPLQPDSAYFGYLKHNAALPIAQKLTLHQYLQNPEAYEAQLVQIDSLYKVSGTWGSGGEVLLRNKAQTDTAMVYINAGTNVASFAEPQYPINITAVVNQHSSGAAVLTGGYELIPVDSAKIIVVSVQDRKNGIPREFYMSPNYPNPFNPSTTIEFGLPREAQVQIVVYNVIGQRVAVLVDRSMKAGNYKMVFEAGRLASGVYFYVMRADDKVFKQKLLLLK